MRPADLIGTPPANLSPRAAADLVQIIRRSARDWGINVAEQTATRLLLRVRAIADGTTVGHTRQDVRPRRRTLFVNELPWVIAYDPDTRIVYRIVHGAREFPAIFPNGPSNGPR